MHKTVGELAIKIRTLDDIVRNIETEQPVDLYCIADLLEEYRLYLGNIKVDI